MAVDIDSTKKTDNYLNLSSALLAEQAVLRGEGRFAANGAIVVATGSRTGRSPSDRFIVDEPSTSESIDDGKQQAAVHVVESCSIDLESFESVTGKTLSDSTVTEILGEIA